MIIQYRLKDNLPRWMNEVRAFVGSEIYDIKRNCVRGIKSFKPIISSDIGQRCSWSRKFIFPTNGYHELTELIHFPVHLPSTTNEIEKAMVTFHNSMVTSYEMNISKMQYMHSFQEVSAPFRRGHLDFSFWQSLFSLNML